MAWDYIIDNLWGEPVLKIKWLLKRWGRHIDLHKIDQPDLPQCFHSHPATAIRIILWKGYVEELRDGSKRRWLPGMIGIVRPGYIHRIDKANGSLSLWLRSRITHPILLYGQGWPEERRED